MPQPYPTNQADYSYLNMSALANGSSAWKGAYNDHLRTDRADGWGRPAYASLPTVSEHATGDESEDDVLVFMVGELYEDDAGSSSATSSDNNAEADNDMPEDMTETEKILFSLPTSKVYVDKAHRTTPASLPTSLQNLQPRQEQETSLQVEGGYFRPRFGKQYHMTISDATNAKAREDFLAHLNAYFGSKGKGKGNGRTYMTSKESDVVPPVSVTRTFRGTLPE